MGVRSLRSSVVFSLGLHVLFFLACFLLLYKQAAHIAQHQPIFVELVNPRSKPFKNQIVQTSPGNHVREAPNEAFLGKNNQTVDRQTISRNHRTVIGQARPHPSVKSLTKPEPNETPLSRFGLPIVPSQKEQDQFRDEPEWSHMDTLPEDYVKGLKESDRTALNTKQYVFFGYFQRIRERLDRAWVPILRERLGKIYRMGRQLASDMDHTTRVIVILNSKGEIVRVRIVVESGTRDLDDAAVSAFNEAGPFPNPPKGIVDRDGFIEIPWEFILKT